MPQSNRESISHGDQWDKKVGLLRRYGVSNVWVNYSEQFQNHRYQNLDLNGDQWRAPEYFSKLLWKVQSENEEINVWQATSIRKIEENLTQDSIDQLINNWGISIIHGYYSSISNANSEYLNFESENIVISPYFNSILSYLRKREEEGLLWNTTVHEFFRFQSLINSTHITWVGDEIEILLNKKIETNFDRMQVILTFPLKWIIDYPDYFESWKRKVVGRGLIHEDITLPGVGDSLFVKIDISSSHDPMVVF